jgi:hypothetical protein
MPFKGHKFGPQTDEHKAKLSAVKRGKPRASGSGRPANTPDVLWAKVRRGQPDECWPWIGFCNAQGYGRTWIGDHGYYAHRVIFDLVNPGRITLKAPPIKDGGATVVRHTCDNPPCCNPRHLVLGTHTDNMQDKVRRGRLPDYSGDKGPRCKLTMDEAREIRRVLKCGMSSRELARLFGVSRPVITSIGVGRCYREAPRGL